MCTVESPVIAVEESVLLCSLREERQKYTKANPTKIARLVDKLVEKGVYPAKSKLGYSARRMVEYWGENWNQYSEPHNCPACDADLRDLQSGPPFKKEIALSDGESVYAWKCHDCQHIWLRF